VGVGEGWVYLKYQLFIHCLLEAFPPDTKLIRFDGACKFATVFIIVLTDPILRQLNPVNTSLLCLCIWGDDTSLTDVGTVAVPRNTPYRSLTVRESVLLAEASPVSYHNRKVLGYTVSCPVIKEGVFYRRNSERFLMTYQ